ncbi:MAG: hypothetical protein QXE64_00745 [Candidatus Pacearchaeota archaeon]
MKSLKLIGLLMLVLTGIFAFSVAISAFAAAQPEIAVMDVYLNSHYVSSETFSIERGSTLSVKVLFLTSDISESGEVRVKAWIDGYRNEIKAETERFDIFAGRLYSKTLNLRLPDDMEDGLYTLHVLITGKQALLGDTSREIALAVQRSNYLAEVLSVNLDLPAVIEAGKTLTATAVIKNRGSHKLEDIYVKAIISELGIEKTVYIGDLYARDYADDTERDTKVVAFSFSIPSNAESKTYTLHVIASNPDASAEKSANFEVKGKVIEGETKVTETLTITTPSERAEVNAGEKARYEVVLINMGLSPLTIELSLSGLEGWARGSLSKTALVLPPRSSDTVTIELTADESALSGAHIFSLQATSAGKLIASKNLVAEVKGKELKAGGAGNIGLWIAIAILAAIALAMFITLIVLLVRQPKQVEKVEEIYY